MTGLLAWLAQTAPAQWLAHNPLAFPLLETVHVLAISLVLGTATIFDIRLLGLGWQGWPAGPLLTGLRKVALAGFAGALASGALLFLSQPESYAQNLPFRAKLALLALAGLNLALFEGRYGRQQASWQHSASVPAGARVQAGLSLGLWGAVLVAGRLIGFFLQG